MRKIADKISKISVQTFLYFLSFVVLSLPRSINALSDNVAVAVNIFKVAIFVLVIFLAIVNRVRVSNLPIIFIIYFVYVTLVTVVNNVDIITALKTYSLNTAMILLVELVLSSKNRNKMIELYSNYFLLLLSINFLEVLVRKIFGVGGTDYLLGMDNRFILYILPTIVGYYYLDAKSQSNNNKIKLLLTYAIGLLSTIMVWSVAALGVLIFISLGTFIVGRFGKNIRINAKIACLVILAISAALVLFKFHEAFAPFITDVLHKNVSLSYRTYMWDVAINNLRLDPIHMVFGFGFFDYSAVLSVLPFVAARVNHFHNLLIDVCYAGGIVGVCIYVLAIIRIAWDIDRIKVKDIRNRLAIVLMGLMILLVFESFELYQVYYYSLMLLGGCIVMTNTELVPKNRLRDKGEES